MRVTEEFSNSYVQPILDDWAIPSGIGSGTGSVGAPIGGGYYEPSAPAYDTYQPSYGGKPPGALEDGLGHWWNEATQQWENDSGGAYVAPQPDLSSIPQGIGSGTGPAYAPAPQPSTYLGDSANSGVYEQNGNVWENGNWWNANNDVWSNELANWFKPQDLNQAWQDIQQHDNSQFPNEITPTAAYGQVPVGRADFVNYDLNQANQRNDNPRAAFLDYDLGTMPQKDDRAWWEKGLDAATGFAGDVLNSKPAQIAGQGIGHIANIANPGSMAFKQLTGYGAGDAFNDYNNWIGDPIAETGAQLTPFIPGITQSMLAVQALGGPRFQDSASGGLGELGSALKESGGNPLDFAKAQNANFDERPAWQQFGAQAAFDPTNLVPGIGMVNYGGDVARAGVKGAKALGALETGIEEFPTLGRLAGSEVGELRFGKKAIGAADEALNPVRQKVVDAVKAEYDWRVSGEAEDIKHAKRVQQSKGIDAAVPGATSAETLANVRAGMRTGEFFDRTPGMQLSEEDFHAALKEIMDSTESFDKSRLLSAVDKLQNGIHPQPKEIEALGEYYGAEFADMVRKTKNGRISSIAELTDEDIKVIAQKAKIDNAKVARLEVQAAKQHELADTLMARSRMDPTNKSLKKVAEEARARGIAQENEADRLLAKQAEEWAAKQQKKAEDAVLAGNKKEVDAAIARDKRLAKGEESAAAAAKRAAEDEWISGFDNAADPYAVRQARTAEREQKWMADQQERARLGQREQTYDEWAKALDEQGPDAYAKAAAKREADDMKKLGEQQDRARAKQADTAATKAWKESGQESLAKAEKIIAEKATTPALKQQADDAVDLWIQHNGILLDAMGDEAPGFFRKMYASVVGEVTDSWTSKLITQRSYLQNALVESGYSDRAARQISRHMTDMEVARRYGADVPEWVTKSLEQAAPRGSAASVTSLEGMAALSQEFKNTAFSIGDVAVLLVNLPKTVATEGVSLLAGSVNRIVNMGHWGIDTSISQGNLPRHVTDLLDGSGTHAKGIVDVTHEGTLLRNIPGMQKADEVWSRLAGQLSDIQYRKLMGFFRNLSNEGNLALLKLSGADIQNPAVRQRAMDWANAGTSAGKLAQRTGRATAERGLALTPTMRRAQGQQVGMVARGLTALGQDAAWAATLGKVSRNLSAEARVDRVMAATTILSTGAAILAVGKYVNDWVGVGDFEMNPGKPGFGWITFKDGTEMNLFPQEQIPIALARSLKVLVDDGVNQDDMMAIAKEWGKVGIGSASPPIGAALKAAGYGFQPGEGEGYKFGNWGEGMTPGERAMGILPVPPIAQQLWQDKKEGNLSLKNTAIQVAGGNVHQESTWSEFYRELESKGQSSDTFWQKSPKERDAFFAANPKAKALMEQIDKDTLDKAINGRDSEAEKTIFFDDIKQIDARRLDNEKQAADKFAQNRDAREFRERLDKVQAMAAAERAESERAHDPEFETSTDPLKVAKSKYFAVYDQNRVAGVDLDYDAVEKGLADLQKQTDPKIWAELQASLGQTAHDPAAQKIYDAKDKIREIGYWDVNDRVWAKYAPAAYGEAYTGGSAEAFYAEMAQKTYEKAIAKGLGEYEAGVLVQQVIKKLAAPYNDITGDVKKAWREADPALMRALIEAGYYEPGVEATGKILAGAK